MRHANLWFFSVINQPLRMFVKFFKEWLVSPIYSRPVGCFLSLFVHLGLVY